jgi:hypothetical protein
MCVARGEKVGKMYLACLLNSASHDGRQAISLQAGRLTQRLRGDCERVEARVVGLVGEPGAGRVPALLGEPGAWRRGCCEGTKGASERRERSRSFRDGNLLTWCVLRRTVAGSASAEGARRPRRGVGAVGRGGGGPQGLDRGGGGEET